VTHGAKASFRESQALAPKHDKLGFAKLSPRHAGDIRTASGADIQRRAIGLRPDQRIVTKLPLAELWDGEGTLMGGRICPLGQNSLAELVRTGPVLFVVADCGTHLEWKPMQERFAFWKAIQSQIADPDPHHPIRLEQFPNETAYTVSKWRGRNGECVVLLEKHH